MTSASVFPDSDVLESELTNPESAHDETIVAEAPESEALEPAAAPEMTSVTIPDRADAPVSEITERFFKAIIAQVPVDRIEELHLFAPLRQGGVETGIAVIAARVLVPVAPVPVVPDVPLELPLPEAETERAGTDIDIDTDIDGDIDDDAVVANTHVTETIDASSSETSQTDAADAEAAPTADADASPYAPETLHEIVVDATQQSMAEVAQAAAVVERHTVYTARYRLVQKGPERGKWEASVVDEADAPLITVDLVVRGVQRRAGEASDTTRYTGAQIARALRLPPAS